MHFENQSQDDEA